jgi:hypothetical protein
MEQHSRYRASLCYTIVLLVQYYQYQTLRGTAVLFSVIAPIFNLANDPPGGPHPSVSYPSDRITLRSCGKGSMVVC